MQDVENQHYRAGGGNNNSLREAEVAKGDEIYTQREDIANEAPQQGEDFWGKVAFDVCEGPERGWFLVIRSVLSFLSHINAPGIFRRSKDGVFVRRRQWSRVPLNFGGVDFGICA